MAFHQVKQRWMGFFGLLICASACGAPEAPGGEAFTEMEPGQLRLPLLTANEDSFRLSQAQFEIETVSGARLLTLDSETDPQAEQLEAELTPGSYRSRLESGWVLERIADDGAAAPINAALLTPNPAAFQIQTGRTTQLEYTFSTDQGTVTLGEGQLVVTIDVNSTPVQTECNPLDSNACRSGQVCLLAGEAGGTYCASPGTLPVGAECSSEQCVPGAQCLALDEDEPSRRTCTKFCSLFNTEFGCNCISVGARDQSLGVCGPLPSGACDLLAQTGCAPDQACQFTSGAFGTCGASGAGVQGEACTADSDCAAGFDCFNRFFGDVSRCSAFCDISQGQFEACAEFGGFCSFVGTGNVGRCE